jgi:hypothetical protein
LAPEARAPSISWITSFPVISGLSPSSEINQSHSGAASSTRRTAPAVPVGGDWTMVSNRPSIPRRWGRSASAGLTTAMVRSGLMARPARKTRSTTGTPATGWRCLGSGDFIRVPNPAASTATVTLRPRGGESEA